MGSRAVMPFLAAAVLVLSIPGRAGATTTTLHPGDQINLDSTGSNDIQGTLENPSTTRIDVINSTTWTASSDDWASTTVCSGNPTSTNPFIPSYYGSAYLIKTGSGTFFKLRATGASTGTGIPIEYVSLGTSPCAPPSSAFTWEGHDLIVDFTDTSTGSPTSWSWSFGDGGTSTERYPRHIYASAGSRTACLTAANGGGADPSPACQTVSVSTVTSTTVNRSSTLDVDGDHTGDLQVLAPSGCSASILQMIRPVNGAEFGSEYKAYAEVTLADAQAAGYSSSDLCPDVYEYYQPLLIHTANNHYAKAWIPEQTGTYLRIQWEDLGGPPLPPDSAFTWQSYDLIVDFTDTSTGTVTGWSWTFGDGDTSSSQNPRHVYPSAGTRSACLTASNSGGSDSSPACHSVVVSMVPSTTVPVNGSIDFNGDGVADLQVVPQSGCGGSVVNMVRPLNGATFNTAYGLYSTITGDDAIGIGYSGSDYCYPAFDPYQVLLVYTGSQAYAKAWAPDNDASGIRFQHDLMIPFADGFESGATDRWSKSVPITAPLSSGIELAPAGGSWPPR